MIRRRDSGLTLVELLMSLVILAIVLGFGIPALGGFIQSQRLVAASNDLLGGLIYARATAIQLRKRVTLCRSSDGTSCATEGGYNQGWLVFADAGTPGTRDTGDSVLRVGGGAEQITITGNTPVRSYVSYMPTGVSRLASGGFQAGTISACIENDGRKLILNRVGRVRISRDMTGC
jgi:type IV fimbrial biogenesis protein FimT